MAEAFPSLFSTLNGRYSYGKAQDMLAFALLETVRIVLEEGRDVDTDEDKHAPASPGAYEMTCSDHTSSDSYVPAARNRRMSHAKAANLLGGPCAHCGATESPQWRRPLAKKMVLCNACGIYYSRHHSLPKRKRAAPQKRAMSDDGEDVIGAELDPRDALSPACAIKMPVAAKAARMAKTAKQASARGCVQPTESASSAECVPLGSACVAAPVAVAVAAPVSSPVAVASPPSIPAPPPGSTFVTAARATRKRTALYPIELPPMIGSAAIKKQAMQPASSAAPPPVAASLAASPMASPIKAPSVAASDVSSPSGVDAVKSTVTGLPLFSAAMQLASGALGASPEASPRSQAPAWPARTVSGLSADSDSGTILIPISTCRGPRRVPSRKASVLSTL